MIKFSIPLGVKIGKKNWRLNLGVYRNSHRFTLDKAKKLYKAEIERQIGRNEGEPMEFSKCSYQVFFDSKRKFDYDNIYSIAMKFVNDALVELGWIKEDNSFHHYPPILHEAGEVDKTNGRVEVTCFEITKKREK